MNSTHIMMLIGAPILSSLISGFAPASASADCHHSVQSHLQQSCNSFVENLSIASINPSTTVAGAYKGASPEEQLVLVQKRIEKLDNDLAESLDKITRYQDQEFNDSQNSKQYQHDIAIERQNLNNDEDELANLLSKQSEIKAHSVQHLEEHQVENKTSSNQFHDNLN